MTMLIVFEVEGLVTRYETTSSQCCLFDSSRSICVVKSALRCMPSLREAYHV
jgi:hypothetical protein